MSGTLNDLCDNIHADNVTAGWWDGPMTPLVVATKIALIHSEISEALEGFRKDLPDAHLPHRRNAEVELADALIRVFDLAGAHGFDMDGAVAEKRAYNVTRRDHKAAARAGSGGKKY